MTGLRVYRNLQKSATHSAGRIFYTRRAGGPYYRWSYEELRGQWLPSRLHATDMESMELVHARWNNVPPALKSRLSEHYMD